MNEMRHRYEDVPALYCPVLHLWDREGDLYSRQMRAPYSREPRGHGVGCAPRHWTVTNISNGTWLLHMCDTAIAYVWHDSFICVTRLTHICDITRLYAWRDSFICVASLIHMFDMTRSHMWHNSFTCVTWLIHMCDMAHSYVWHDSFIYVTWFIYVSDMTHSYVWHDSFICVASLTHMFDMLFTICDNMQERCESMQESGRGVGLLTVVNIMSNLWTSHVTHMKESRHAYEWVMSRRFRGGSNKWVMSLIKESCLQWISRVSNKWVMSSMNQSCLSQMTCVTWLIHRSLIKESHIWMSHVSNEWVMSSMNESCL